MSHPLLTEVREVLTELSDADIAAQQRRYLRDQFDFFGIKSPEQKQVFRAILRPVKQLPAAEVRQIVSEAWTQPQREFQYFALYVIEKYHKTLPDNFIDDLESCITTRSWWDTVDWLAKLTGRHFRHYPTLIRSTTFGWMSSENIWLQRVCLIFQLFYRDETDVDLLFGFIRQLRHSKEFFIQKAMGWALRQHSCVDAQTVVDFVETHELPALTRREALRLLNQ